MSKLKHTKGEWKVDPDCKVDVYSEINHICTCFTNSKEEHLLNAPEAFMNAKLIATAPEMLNQLIDLYSFMKDCQDTFGKGMMDSIILSNTEDTIEKATGLKIEEILNSTT